MVLAIMMAWIGGACFVAATYILLAGRDRAAEERARRLSRFGLLIALPGPVRLAVPKRKVRA